MNHKDLDVWKRSISLVTDIYKITKAFPKEELYGLTSQLRRAAVSIPSNIAEGSARNSNKEYVHFLYISLSSLSETETQLIIANKINYINDCSEILLETEAIKSMILGLINYLKKQEGKR